MTRIVDVPSTITGTVWTVDAAVGDRLRQDDPVVTLEAMKMEIPVGAPAAGEVVEILVVKDDHVEEGQPVARLKV
jgi:acetyl-CoA carboxylase biotin carboxyl carrier protein